MLSTIFSYQEAIDRIDPQPTTPLRFCNLVHNATQMGSTPIVLKKCASPSKPISSIRSFTKGWTYNLAQCFKSLSIKIWTLCLTPVIIASGVTAPGRTPRFSKSRSEEPNDKRPTPNSDERAFRSIALYCSATSKIFRFLWSRRYRFSIWPPPS